LPGRCWMNKRFRKSRRQAFPQSVSSNDKGC
jgi:hypothetical protein